MNEFTFRLPGFSIEGKVRNSGPPEERRWRNWGATLNQRLKSLIQQLGEAIHESVAESEQIAGVVQDIRRHGFDVLLMLEATIGLNELEQQPTAQLAATSSTEAVAEPEARVPFSSNDVNFLKSLRIAVEGEPGN
jgi:hypothetical protein